VTRPSQSRGQLALLCLKDENSPCLYTRHYRLNPAHTRPPQNGQQSTCCSHHMRSWREKWQSRQGFRSTDQSAPFSNAILAPFLLYFNVSIFVFLLHHLHLVHPFCFGHLYWWSIASSRHSFLELLLNNLPSCFAFQLYLWKAAQRVVPGHF
jgi:hypothetical protein